MENSIFEEHISQKDIELLASCPWRNQDDSSYSVLNVQISKPWGFEKVVFHDDHCAVWDLFIKEGESTSFHCHPNKSTVIIMTAGIVECRLCNKTYTLSASDILILGKGVFHSSKCLSPGGAKLIEINSPPLLTDLVRIEDKYGRAGRPY